jgi:hypothetical protein
MRALMYLSIANFYLGYPIRLLTKPIVDKEQAAMMKTWGECNAKFPQKPEFYYDSENQTHALVGAERVKVKEEIVNLKEALCPT